MHITNERTLALGEHLEQYITFDSEKLTVHGCDHTLRYTLAWIEAHHYDRELWLDYLQRNGGFCDCEVLMNVVYRIDEHQHG